MHPALRAPAVVAYQGASPTTKEIIWKNASVRFRVLCLIDHPILTSPPQRQHRAKPVRNSAKSPNPAVRGRFSVRCHSFTVKGTGDCQACREVGIDAAGPVDGLPDGPNSFHDRCSVSLLSADAGEWNIAACRANVFKQYLGMFLSSSRSDSYLACRGR